MQNKRLLLEEKLSAKLTDEVYTLFQGGITVNEQYNSKLVPNSKRLRKEMTKEERHLWYDFLKQLPITVHRQKTMGKYIVDFYIASAKIVIELDGSQHYEEQNQIADIQRDEYLSQMGCKILRYSNMDVNNRFQGVCEDILYHLDITDSP